MRAATFHVCHGSLLHLVYIPRLNRKLYVKDGAVVVFVLVPATLDQRLLKVIILAADEDFVLLFEIIPLAIHVPIGDLNVLFSGAFFEASKEFGRGSRYARTRNELLDLLQLGARKDLLHVFFAALAVR